MMFKGDGLYAQAIGQLIHENNYKIKIIVMQHGLIASIPQYKNLRIDEFWVWSKFFKNRLLNLGVNYSIKVLGDPTTDNFFNRKELLKINAHVVDTQEKMGYQHLIKFQNHKLMKS